MKRIVSLVIAAVLFFHPTPVAAEALVLTSAQIDLMSRYCEEARGHMERLHYSDALLRVNLGQRYENISTRLMAPLNSRIALAGDDGVELSKTTVEFNKKLDEFRDNYLAYDNEVDSVMNRDCRQQPVEFYQSIQMARQKRQVVHDDVNSLSRYIKQYKTQFEAFAKSVNDEKEAS